MADFVKLAATAKRLIEKNGRAVTLYRRERTPAVSSDPWRGTPASAKPEATLGPVKMAFVPAGGSGLGKMITDASGQLTKEIDQVGFLAADSVVALSPAEPDVKKYDTLVDGSERAYKIQQVGELKPADTTVIYFLGLKG